MQLNESFIDEYGSQWRTPFEGMNKKEIWAFLYPQGRPSLGTFYNHAKEYKLLQDYLNYLLIQNKYWSLSKLGYDRPYIKVRLTQFQDCGRYMVNYKGGKSFATW